MEIDKNINIDENIKDEYKEDFFKIKNDKLIDSHINKDLLNTNFKDTIQEKPSFINRNNDDNLTVSGLTKGDFSKNNIIELQKKLKIKIDKEIFQINSGVKKLYIILITLLLISILINIVIWFIDIKLVFKILIAIFTIPILITVVCVILFRLFLLGDLDKLKGNIRLKFSSNFIIANFFLTQKRILKRICPLNDDGISFLYGEGLYTLDSSCVWLDENGHPNAFYIPNMPNPLQFNFYEYLKKGLDNFRENDIENFKEDLDILYSPENLKLFKKDKLVQELHRDNSEQLNKLIMFIVILCGLSLVAITIIVLVLGNKQQTIQVVANMTQAMPQSPKVY